MGNAGGSFKDLFSMDELLGRGEFGFVHRVTHKSSKKTQKSTSLREILKYVLVQY